MSTHKVLREIRDASTPRSHRLPGASLQGEFLNRAGHDRCNLLRLVHASHAECVHAIDKMTIDKRCRGLSGNVHAIRSRSLVYRADNPRVSLARGSRDSRYSEMRFHRTARASERARKEKDKEGKERE